MTRLAPPVAAPHPGGAAQRRVTRESLWLFSGYAVTAGSGFFFWIVAAAMVPQAELGVDAAIISVVSAVAAFASSGPGAALIVMLPGSGALATTLLRHSFLGAATVAALLGAAVGAIVATIVPGTGDPLPLAGVIAVLAALWTLFNLQAQALAGAGDARATLFVGGAASLLKLALVPVLVTVVVGFEHPVVLATMLPAALAVAVSVLVLVPRAIRRDDTTAAMPAASWRGGLAPQFRSFVAQNTLAVGIVLGVNLSLVFVVSVLSSPAEAAIFAIAFQFSTAIDLLGVGVATALARNVATDFTLATRLATGFAWKVSAAALALAVAVTAAVPIMFALLGEEYDPGYGAAVVGVLAAASVLRPPYDMWSALLRARRRILPVLTTNAAYTAVVAALVLVLIPSWGALGAAATIALGAAALAVVGAVGLHRLPRHTVTAPVAALGGAR